ncbi:MAG: T9SS type A sorting domain-containing protein [Bacteroidia bacterium]|nr:T9SS type A sorting domain-containing protein [Bacteroidia bacterium]
MEKIYTLKLTFKLIILAIILSFSSKIYAVQLSGSYTIDSAGTASTIVFLDFSSAITYMTGSGVRSDAGPSNSGTFGVSGPVVFDVLQGTYVGAIDITAITGASATNTITFDGGIGNVATRIMQNTATSSTNAHTLRFNSSSFITFKNITIKSLGTNGIGVHFYLAANNINIKQCSILVSNASSTTTRGLAATNSNLSSTGSGCSSASGTAFNIFIDSNYISGGNIGVFLSSSSNTSIPHNFYVRWNTIENAFATGIGASSSNGYLVESNYIKMAAGNTASKGMHHCNGSSSGIQSYKVVSNIFENCGQYGIHFQSNNSNTNTLYPTVVANNYFKPTFSNTTSYGMDMSQPRNLFVLNNTILMNMAGGIGITIGSSAGTLCKYKNNIIALQAANSTGLCFVSTGANVDSCDYNVFMKNSTTSLNIATILSSTYNKTNFIGGGGFNLNSTMEDPRLSSISDPRPGNICQKGQISVHTLKDINGLTRPNPPQIGCAEGLGGLAIDAAVTAFIQPVSYPLSSGAQDIKVLVKNSGNSTITSMNVTVSLGGSNTSTVLWTGTLGACNIDTVTFSGTNQLTFASGTNNLRAWVDSPNFLVDSNAVNDTIDKTFCTPLTVGTYTIGSGGTFSTFNEVANLLNCGGISGTGPTVFNVLSGSYNEQFALGLIPGTSAVNTITFQSQAGNADSVTISYNSGTSNNYVIKLAATSFVKFKDLKLQSLNSTSGIVIEMAGAISSDTITNCKLLAPVVATTGSSMALIFANGITGKLNSFTNNTFTNGSYGMYFYGSSLTQSIDSSFIENNVFTNCYYMTIAISNTLNLKVRNNIINGSSFSSSYGIYFVNSANAFEINNNIITAVGTSGIYLSSVNGTATLLGNIRNNTISGGFTSTYYGMYMSSCTYMNVYNNSVVGNSTATSTNYACYTQFTSSTGTTVVFRNNIFSNNAIGTAITVASLYVYNTLYLNSNYNNLHCAGPNLVNVATPALTHQNIYAWRNASTFEKNSVSYRPGYTSNTNLVPNPLDSNAWSINGHGAFIAGNNTDILGNPRPQNVTQGAPDLGAYEFTPTSIPPAALTNNAQLAPDSTQIFMFAGDTVASIKWDTYSLVPTSVAVRRYSGVRPNYIDTNANNYMYYYTQISGAYGYYLFTVNQYYKNEWLGRVPSETVIKAATKDTTSFSTWTPFTSSSSTVDTVRNMITLPGNYYIDYIYTGTDNNNPLPVKLLKLNARLVKTNVDINWRTGEEINNKGFDVERSINGKTFEKIGFVKGVGNSNLVNNYHLIDENAFEKTTVTTLFYRLKQIDFNGASSYSNAVIVKKDAGNSEPVFVYPNPFKEKLNIDFIATAKGEITIQMIDISGKIIENKKVETIPGNNSILFETNHLVSGVYMMHIVGEGINKTLKLVK